MERLTIPDKKIDGVTRRFLIDARKVRRYAMKIYWALKEYEDTNLTPEEINGLKENNLSDIKIIEIAASLRKLKKYEKIGTVEELQEAIERQQAKKLLFYGDLEDGKMICQNCKEDLMDLAECGFNCCPYCGQRLDWS